MKALTLVLVLMIGAAAGAGGLYVWMQGPFAGDGDDNGDEILYYRNPMDPSITSDEFKQDHMGMDYIPVYASDKEDNGDDRPGMVNISPAVAQNLGVRKARAERGELTPEVTALGFVDYDEAGLVHTHVRTEAWVEDLQVRTTGAAVSEGQILFRIDSPRLINAQEELLQAHRRNAGIGSARDRLRSLGMADQDIRELENSGQVMRLVPVRARRDGVVRELNLSEGMFVRPGDTLMEIADLSSVWVMLELFEADMDLLRPGQPMQVSLPFRPDVSHEGELEFVYPTLETDRRVQKARLVLDNPNGDLKPGMYARVALSGEPLADVVHVPAESVMRTGRNDRMVVAMEEGGFQVREVRVGRRVGDRFEIREGIDAGEQVVVSGQFLLDSESSTVADLERLAAAEDDDEVWTRGRVERIADDGKTAMLQHEPVPEWGWPEMTMEFQLAEGLDPELLQQGQAIRFRMREHPEGGYEVTAMEADDDDAHEHDAEGDGNGDVYDDHQHGSRWPQGAGGRDVA